MPIFKQTLFNIKLFSHIDRTFILLIFVEVKKKISWSVDLLHCKTLHWQKAPSSTDQILNWSKVFKLIDIFADVTANSSIPHLQNNSPTPAPGVEKSNNLFFYNRKDRRRKSWWLPGSRSLDFIILSFLTWPFPTVLYFN